MKTNSDFIWNKAYWNTIRPLDTYTRDAIVCALCAYAFDGVEPEGLSPLANGIFMALRTTIDVSRERKDEISRKRSEAGKRGNEKRWGDDAENRKHRNCDTCDDLSQKSQTSQMSQTSQLRPSYNIDNNITSFLPSFDAHARRIEGKKEEFFIKLMKEALRKGAKEPKEEVARYWEHNSGAGWLNGRGRAISDPVQWFSNWKLISGTEPGISRYADVYIDLLQAAHLDEDEQMIDGFAGAKCESGDATIFFKSAYIARRFAASEGNSDFLSRMQTVCDIHFPGAKITYKVKQ